MKIKTIVALITLVPLYTFSQNDLAIQNYLRGEYNTALPGLTSLSQSRNSEATFDLGMMYLRGEGVNKDPEKAEQLILQAATQNYIPAQLFLAKRYLIEKNDINSAMNWFQKAADLGNLEAQMFCMTTYLYGYGLPQNIEKSRKFVIKAAQNGDSLAQYELAKLFINNKSTKDQALAGLWLTKAAATGEVNSQNLLGLLLLTGTKLPQDIPKAINYLTEAAVSENKNASLTLFSYFLSLPSSPENLRNTIYWLSQGAVTQNTPQQLTRLKPGTKKLFFLKAHSTKKNIPETLQQWLKLAKTGDINAAQQVGYLYSIAPSTAANQQAAIQWLSKAAAANNYTAKVQLVAVKSRWSNLQADQQTRILSPKLVSLTAADIFDPNYQMQDPNSLPVEDIIQAIGRINYETANHQLTLSKQKLKLTTKKYLIANKQEIIRESHLGYPQSQYQLGLMYQYGFGMKKDLQQAVQLYQLAASRNYAKAKYQLALLTIAGKGMPKDYKVAESLLTQAAFQGDAPAQLLLGKIYEMGYGEVDNANSIKKDLLAAKAMYSLAAINNNAVAQYRLAQLYISTLLDSGDYAQQRYLLQQAAKLFDQAASTVPQAKLLLAFFYLNPAQSASDQQWAFSVAEQFAAQNNPEANLLLALMYSRGIGTKQDINKALQLSQNLADADNPIGLYIMGSNYGLGLGVPKDEDLANQYLTRSADKNIGFANYNLAVSNYQNNNIDEFLSLLKQAKLQDFQPASILLADYYLTHPGDPADMKQAIDIYQNLASSGNIQAQIKLAFMYQHGIYFDTNYPLALEWYQKAAAANNALAQFAVGEMYQLGQGTNRDLTQATQWYLKAAKQQFPLAQLALGYINDVDQKNYLQARDWYELAATNNRCPIANYNLGLLYQYGKGMPVDVSKAEALYQQAADHGSDPAITALNELTNRQIN